MLRFAGFCMINLKTPDGLDRAFLSVARLLVVEDVSVEHDGVVLHLILLVHQLSMSELPRVN